MDPSAPAAGMPAGPSRLGWLDALRGIAALVVVFDHSSYAFMAEFRRELMPEFNTSRYGIMVFFLVSGHIIPASLERRGCVRAFWIGRLFRIYPLWMAAVSDGTIGRWPRDNLVLEVAFYAVLLPLCVVTYRYIEAPSQNWGRKLARRHRPPSPPKVRAEHGFHQV